MTARSGEPRPVAVRHNDWRQVELPDRRAFAPARPVSVIVPCFQAPEKLALTLAGLERQAWPCALLEVVVVDDGSDPPLAIPARSPLDLKVVRQERRGFGLARARNAGVHAAAHDILVFLDDDVIPEAGLVAAHARWHHALADVLTLGFCTYVSVAGIDVEAVRARRGSLGELFAGRPFDRPWIERHMARTADLTSRHGDLFRAVTGHNFGVSRTLFDEAGGFDESFTRYGGEDTEFAWRVQVCGGLLVPERGAFGWHQGRWADGREAKQRDLDMQAETLAELIAEPGFRRGASGRRFAVPRHVVTLDAGQYPADRVIDAADALLADPAGDLALRIEIPPRRMAGTAELRQRLHLRFGQDSRVQIAPEEAALDAFPASPLHIAIPAGRCRRPRTARPPRGRARRRSRGSCRAGGRVTGVDRACLGTQSRAPRRRLARGLRRRAPSSGPGGSRRRRAHVACRRRSTCGCAAAPGQYPCRSRACVGRRAAGRRIRSGAPHPRGARAVRWAMFAATRCAASDKAAG